MAASTEDLDKEEIASDELRKNFKRKPCVESKNDYFKCLDEMQNDKTKCVDKKEIFDSKCLPSWIRHFEIQRFGISELDVARVKKMQAREAKRAAENAAAKKEGEAVAL